MNRPQSRVRLSLKIPGARCPIKTVMPPMYTNFKYANEGRESMHSCPSSFVRIYLYRTPGLREEQREACSKEITARKDKCMKTQCRYNSCDNIGDWYGSLNGTSLDTVVQKTKYVMDPDNNIASRSKEHILQLCFYHPETGYIFNMELGYSMDSTGRFNVLSVAMSRAAPLNPFFSAKEWVHFFLNIFTCIFVLYEGIKAWFTMQEYRKEEKEDRDGHTMVLSFEDYVFAFITAIASFISFCSTVAFSFYVFFNCNRNLESIESWLCFSFGAANITGSIALIFWILAFFGKLRFQ